MPNYEEVIQQAQENIKSLSEKLKELDKLHQDIKELIKQPQIFDAKYQQILKLSEDYTNTLGASTKKYLDGNNTLFTTQLIEFSVKIKDLQKEISRLINTDFTKLFQDLQKSFIDQTRKDLAAELKKIDDKSKDLQSKIDELRKQVERLENIDLDKHFERLQKTLSEIFNAINAINLNLTSITQSLNTVVQALGAIKAAIGRQQEIIYEGINETNKNISREIRSVKEHIDHSSKILISELASHINSNTAEIIKHITEQNQFLKKVVIKNRIIQLGGLTIVLIILLYCAMRQVL